MNLPESGYREAGESLRGPLQVLVSPSAPLLRNRGSGGPLQHQHLFQVVAHPLQPKVIVVSPQAQIATSRQPIAALQGADDSLHGLAHPRKEFIPFLLVATKGVTTPGPANDAAKYPPASQRLFPGSLGVGGIGKYRGFIAADQLLKLIRLGEVGSRQRQTPSGRCPGPRRYGLCSQSVRLCPCWSIPPRDRGWALPGAAGGAGL